MGAFHPLVPLSSKRWEVKSIRSPVPPAIVSRLRGLCSSPVMAQILYNRGLTDPDLARAFLRGETPLSDPFLLKEMPEAVARIREALRRGEPIAIYGDFDADGVTATALLVQALQRLGGRVQPYIPDRADEGYGLNEKALDKLAAQGVRLVITVDSGIRSVDEARHAARLGLDLIVTDHHYPGAVMPEALAVINPKRADCAYPFKELAGVGLAFKLAQALLQAERQEPTLAREVPPAWEENLLDLVALGTVADIVPLQGENRTLVRRGLAQINEAQRPGVRALLERAGLTPGQVNAERIAYVLGPRLNAAGRLRSAMIAYELLNAPDLSAAEPLAKQLNDLNEERQRLTQQALEEAKRQIEESPPQGPVLFAEGEGFQAGIVGLVAGRLTEDYYRPAVVMERGPQTTRGSARSIPEFHITAALDECRDLLVKYGGHAAAAGFTVRNDDVPALKERLQSLAAQCLKEHELVPTLLVDAEVRLADLNENLQRDLARLEPCGYDNPAPILCVRGVKVVNVRTNRSDGKHLILTLTDGWWTWDAIAFHRAHWQSHLTPPMDVDVAFMLEMSEWNGERRLRLNVQDCRRAA